MFVFIHMRRPFGIQPSPHWLLGPVSLAITWVEKGAKLKTDPFIIFFSVCDSERPSSLSDKMNSPKSRLSRW